MDLPQAESQDLQIVRRQLEALVNPSVHSGGPRPVGPPVGVHEDGKLTVVCAHCGRASAGRSGGCESSYGL